MDRASDSGSECWGFESLRACQARKAAESLDFSRVRRLLSFLLEPFLALINRKNEPLWTDLVWEKVWEKVWENSPPFGRDHSFSSFVQTSLHFPPLLTHHWTTSIKHSKHNLKDISFWE